MAEVGEVKYKVVADDSGLDQQINKTEGKLKSKFGAAAKVVGAAATAAVAAGAAAMVSITKQAVSQYAEYEQLIGGTKLLFGANGKSLEEYAESVGKTTDKAKAEYEKLIAAQDYITSKAKSAFKDVQMSQNDYLEQVNGLATGLKVSLKGDAEAAAILADKVVTAEADIVAATGTSQEAVQNAFNGIMKSNYSMLDNLQLGINPTKEGMQEVIDKVNEWNKANGNLTKYQMGNLADMQAALVDYVNMQGMAGYAANEGAQTISGSLAATKAAWDNLLTGMADSEANIGELVNNLIDSASSLLDNLIPVISQALEGIGTAIAEIAPKLADAIPPLIEKVLPPLLESGAKVIESLAKGILAAIPKLMPTVTTVILELVKMLIGLAPQIITVGLQCILELVKGITQALPQLIPAAVDAIITIVEALTEPDMLLQLVDAAILLIITLAEALIEAQPKLIEKAPIIIMNLAEALIKALPKILQAGVELILTLVRGMVSAFGKIVEVGGQLVEKTKSGFDQKVQDAKNWGRDVIQNFIDGIKQKWNDLKATVSSVAQTVKSYLHFSVPDVGPLKDFGSYAPDMMDLYAKGIKDNTGKVEDSIEDVTRVVAGAFTADVGYNLPDIGGYAADLSAAITASSATEIIVPLSIDGREIARASAWFMSEQLAWEAR